jgi:NAD(P)-dependent dehydrogenase (short-subunit alcohol dehydrogenase family)
MWFVVWGWVGSRQRERERERERERTRDVERTLNTDAVIITGAAGGIGRSTVAILASRGVSVLAVDLDVDAVESLAESCRVGGGDVIACPADVANEEDVVRFVRFALARWGRLSAIFNNAAVEGPVQPIKEYPSDEFDRVVRVNVKGTWLGMKHALPALRQSGGGTILNTASTASLMGWPNLSGYIASKHAVIGLTRAVAMECAHEGICVNAICPGPTDTRMIWSIGDAVSGGDRAKARRLQEGNVPAGRIASPGEIAKLAAWLLMDSPQFLTGAAIPVDGGQTAGFGVREALG